MVAKTPRVNKRAIRSFARSPNFSAKSFTLIPSVIVMLRVIGCGSFDTETLEGGTKPFIGPSLTPRGTYRCPGLRDGPPGRLPGRVDPGGGNPGPTPSGRVPVGDCRVGCIGRRSPGRNGGRVPGAAALPGRGRWKIGCPGTGRPGTGRVVAP